MAVSFVEEPHCQSEKTSIISDSKNPSVASKATVIVKGDNDKLSNDCKHFTIRGYVAKARTRNARNSWPFLLHNSASHENFNAFPPLSIAKFRWWGCQNCVREFIAAVSIRNHSLLGNVTQTSQLDASSKENSIKEILRMNHCSTNATGVQNEQIKKGLWKRTYHLNSQNVSNACIASNKGKRGEYRKCVGRKKMGIANLNDALDIAIIKHNGTKMHKIDSSKVLGANSTSSRINYSFCRSKEDIEPEKTRENKKRRNFFRKRAANADMVVEKDNLADANPSHSLCIGSSVTRQASVEENLHNRKIKKIRLLEDIIRSEEQHLHCLDEDAKFIQLECLRRRATSRKKLARFKTKIQNFIDEGEDVADADAYLDQINEYAHQSNLLNLAKTDKHLLKKMPKEANPYKEVNINHVKESFISSSCSSDLSCGDEDVRDRTGFMQNERDCRVASGILFGEVKKFKNFISQDIRAERASFMEKTKHCSIGTSVGLGGNKVPLDRLKLHNIKDSSSMQMKSSSEVWENESEMPRTADREMPDSIPMDIVELLARNQHDRCHTGKIDAKYACGFDPSQININKPEQEERFYTNNDKGFDVWTPFPCNGGSACICSINGKRKLQVDLNKQHSDSASNMHSSRSFLDDRTAACEDLPASFSVKNRLFYEKPVNMVGMHHHLGSSSPAAQNASSFHSNFCPEDLYSNETISALNLLRLMDQAACSGEPRHHIRSYSADKHANDQTNALQVGYGSQEIKPCMFPAEIINPSTCSLFRPLPRIGILGPPLQREIFNFSKYGRIPIRSSSNEFLKTQHSCMNPSNTFFRCKSSENAILPLKGSRRTEICLFNRNPADFTVLGESNEYMIETEEPKVKPPRPAVGQKKQRIMKLDDLKAFAVR